jgi:hypothetical protein
MYGYWPNTPSQWREPTVDDCTWYAGEFAYQAADTLHRNFHPVNDIRNQSSDRVGGTPVDVMLRDMQAFWPEDSGVGYSYGQWKLRDIKRALQSNASVVVGGDYEKLPLHYRRWTNNDYFDHAMTVRFLRRRKDGVEMTALYDPLGGGNQRDPYDGEWIPLRAIFGDEDDYTWRHRDGLWWTGVVDNRRRKDMMKRIFFDAQDTQREAQVFKGTPIYDEPTVISAKNKVLMDDTKFYKLAGRVNADWFAIFSWNKVSQGHDIKYVAASDLKTLRPRAPVEYAPDSDHEAIITTLTAERDTLRARLADLTAKADNATAAWVPFAEAMDDLL